MQVLILCVDSCVALHLHQDLIAERQFSWIKLRSGVLIFSLKPVGLFERLARNQLIRCLIVPVIRQTNAGMRG